MTAPVRYVKFDGGDYTVHDRKTGRWLGDVYHDVAAREWYAHGQDSRRPGLAAFIGTARTRAAAADLILQATGSQT